MKNVRNKEREHMGNETKLEAREMRNAGIDKREKGELGNVRNA